MLPLHFKAVVMCKTLPEQFAVEVVAPNQTASEVMMSRVKGPLASDAVIISPEYGMDIFQLVSTSPLADDITKLHFNENGQRIETRFTDDSELRALQDAFGRLLAGVPTRIPVTDYLTRRTLSRQLSQGRMTNVTRPDDLTFTEYRINV